MCVCLHGAWGSVVVKALRYYSDGPGFDSWWCHWIFQWHISFRPYHGPWVDSAPSENEYQELFLGVKAAGAWGWQTHQFYVPNVMDVWEPKSPGTLWATPGLLRDCFTFTFTAFNWLIPSDLVNSLRQHLEKLKNFTTPYLSLRSL